MNPGNSQFSDWSRGGHTVPGGLDDLGRKVPRLTALDPAFFDTQPAPMDAVQLRSDSIAAASQAPRIPRLHRFAGTGKPSCQGACAQGRKPCDAPSDCMHPRLSPIDESREYGRLWWGVMAIISVIAVAFALAGCGGGDASTEEVSDHDQQTTQPVACAASGCAR